MKDKYLLYLSGVINEETFIKQSKNIKESENKELNNYMFFQNLNVIKKCIEDVLNMNQEDVDNLLEDGHDWANDHISGAKNSIEQVCDWLRNSTNKDKNMENM